MIKRCPSSCHLVPEFGKPQTNEAALFQDKKYGQNMRVFTESGKSRCTVCGLEEGRLDTKGKK